MSAPMDVDSDCDTYECILFEEDVVAESPPPPRPPPSVDDVRPARPPPPSQRHHHGFSEEMNRALGRMYPLGSACNTMLVQTEMHRILPNMHGVDDIRKLLWRLLVTPMAAFQLYATTIGSISSLHFCLVGKVCIFLRRSTRPALTIDSRDPANAWQRRPCVRCAVSTC
jgi:hypothetical protein